LGRTVANQARTHYAALAGLEEARGRLNASAPDTLTASLPPAVDAVLYITNSSYEDPVEPTSPASPYFDFEYEQEFPLGLGSATILPYVSSDQPGAGTASALPYKWVRITLKTERSSRQDINQDGVMDSSTPVYWDGAQQNLSTHLAGGVPVYKLTVMAVDQSGIRKLLQTEVAAPTIIAASAGVATNGSGILNGVAAGGSGPPNLTVDGNDACGASGLPGIVTGGAVTIAGVATVNGSPTPTAQNVSPFPHSASGLIASLRASATPVIYIDPDHISLASAGTHYVGSDAVLGTPASGTSPAEPAIAYSDKSLTLTGSATKGTGILLVSGNLTVTGGLTYRGIIIVDGAVALASDATGSISIQGTLIASGDVSLDSSASSFTTLALHYDSCAVAESNQILPKTILAYRELM